MSTKPPQPPPPQTPTRALLQRIRRRSSALSQPPPSFHPSPPQDLVNHQPLTNQGTIQEGSYQEEEEEEEEAREDQDQQEQAALEHQIDQLLALAERNEERIRKLEKLNSQLESQLKLEREQRSRDRERTEKVEKGGLTRQAAIKLEREFASQEMILKGLQRDNEEKTIEVESIRRKLKLLTDFLSREYGEQDWEAVVSTKLNLSTNLVVFQPSSSSSSSTTTVSSSSSPYKRALNLTSSTVSSSSSSSSTATTTLMDPLTKTRPGHRRQASASDIEEDQGETTASNLQDPNSVLDSIQAIRLLLQGFERRNASRRSELEDMMERANLAEIRALELAGGAG
ncbi:hypothetical protein IE53DRAFT_178874 [Violaceomyces palustris]|uniref:Uncharacterized protein n=1 Tax=Violaceomyces palustris TaxID=1673888 RepID=A0ACD0NSD3_9BASI|nr:hypothetical protein IE53DRAFT_178874 [Violaceomyces palustris]